MGYAFPISYKVLNPLASVIGVSNDRDAFTSIHRKAKARWLIVDERAQPVFVTRMRTNLFLQFFLGERTRHTSRL